MMWSYSRNFHVGLQYDDIVVTHKCRLVFVNNFEKVVKEDLFFFDQCSSASLGWDVLEARGSWFSLKGRLVSLPWQTAKGGSAFVF